MLAELESHIIRTNEQVLAILSDGLNISRSDLIHPAGQISVLLTFILLTTEVWEPAFREQLYEGGMPALLARL